MFKNCIFESASFQDAEFENCNLINCQIKNCNLTRVDFTEITFDKCYFEKVEKGSLVKGWFESCDFLDTNFKGFEGMSLIQIAVVDSKFSKFNKSIEFKGEFFLIDILHSGNRIGILLLLINIIPNNSINWNKICLIIFKKLKLKNIDPFNNLKNPTNVFGEGGVFYEEER